MHARHMLYQLHAWSAKTGARHHIIIMQRQTLWLRQKKTLQYLCYAPLALVFLHLGPHALLFMSHLFLATKKDFAASLPLMQTVLQRFEWLAADGNIICSVVGFVSHPHSFSVVINSFRPHVVESVDELEANLWRRILARRCHRRIGDQFAAREGAIDDGS